MNTVKEQIEEKVLECIIKAESFLTKKIDIPTIDYSLKGRCAGQFQWNKYDATKSTLRYNLVLASENIETFLCETVPHEIAHYIQYILGAKPGHKTSWKNIMRMVFNTTTKRTHDYSIANSARNTVWYIYNCSCGCAIRISKTLFNKMKNGTFYQCAGCKNRIQIEFVHSV